MLWWLSSGEGWDAVTWCGWNKLWKERNYEISRCRCQVYVLRVYVDDCMCVLSDLTWLSLLGGERKWCYIIIWKLVHSNRCMRTVPNLKLGQNQLQEIVIWTNIFIIKIKTHKIKNKMTVIILTVILYIVKQRLYIQFIIINTIYI